MSVQVSGVRCQVSGKKIKSHAKAQRTRKAMSNEQRVMNRGEKKSWRLGVFSEAGVRK